MMSNCDCPDYFRILYFPPNFHTNMIDFNEGVLPRHPSIHKNQIKTKPSIAELGKSFPFRTRLCVWLRV